MLDAVLFDLDGTLYDRDALVEQLAREQYAAFREPLSHVGADAFVARLLALDDHGYGSKPALYARIVQEFGLDAALAVRLQAHFWEAYDRHCQPSQETLTVLSALRQSGKKLGVITNGTVGRQQAKLTALGLADVFDVILISEAEGLRKPDARIFHRAAGRLGVVPPHAMFVGDHPEVDVAGAQAAGLHAVWKRVPYWPLMHDVLAIDSLRELLPLLEAADRGVTPPTT